MLPCFRLPNYYDWAFQAITNLLNANTAVFVSMGQNLFRAFATIMLAWFGIRAAVSAGEHWGGIHFSQFREPCPQHQLRLCDDQLLCHPHSRHRHGLPSPDY